MSITADVEPVDRPAAEMAPPMTRFFTVVFASVTASPVPVFPVELVLVITGRG
jgi:hypothetical protein